MATRLFVGNLPENSEESDVHAAFSSYGKVTSLDLKSKSTADSESENKKFAFVTISGSNYDIESCIKHFSNEDFNGNRLYVTRARESFLERLQRERLEAQQKEAKKVEAQQVFKKNITIELSSRKRKIDDEISTNDRALGKSNNKWAGKVSEINKKKQNLKLEDIPKKNIENDSSTKYRTHDYRKKSENLVIRQNGEGNKNKLQENVSELYKKKQDSDMKRIEAMKKKRQEFKDKQMIVKTGLTGVDKVSNTKIIFSDNEDDTTKVVKNHEKKLAKSDKKNTLFDDDDEDSGQEVNFEIKEQFEGKKGQKVLDLQSRYKSDKRFVLDERFIEDEAEEPQDAVEADEIEINQSDEKDKQLNILQDVLGVPIRRKVPEEERNGKKNKPKLGMLRFDPSQPEHAKFLAPLQDTKQESTKKSKKKKDKQAEEIAVQEQKQEKHRPEVSKEQFYKVSKTLKEAIAQPTTFSLRSLFGNTETVEEETEEKEANYIRLEPAKKSKVKNPLEPGEKNPFVYDSSDSETEEINQENIIKTPVVTESKAVWKENFFFGLSDQRFEEGLVFFNNANGTDHKERRELKSLVKKRIYNKERKDQMQMFKKKIGGRKKTMKKSFRKKN